MTRIALGIAYDGRPWQGWQTQPHGLTVQDTLERALQAFIGCATTTVCAGRTDTGVHGLNQVVHLDTAVNRNLESWVRGTNAHLPDSISVQWAQHVSDDFHARFSATARTYSYVILNTRVRHPLWQGRAGWVFQPLDVSAMQQSAKCLLGQHDFSSFRSSQCQAKTPVRTLHDLNITQSGPRIMVQLKANAFLHHMVRNIVGALIQVGQGRESVNYVSQLLDLKDRTRGAPTFSPDGLYLTNVTYPEQNFPIVTEETTGLDLFGLS
ncbi:tRNA pseudouridine(38-40) synthase TruA [Zwartia sp.]|uniref:tRNA pseudouridine(38-40) synthase TruA n=1 Tax=Zwartia sp. TaxID=2978004 RepID=UPI00271DB8F6|nr:tRNA pseudouridine(38-40) synthase TruA [Zwartia sp.]MDO9024851.1 tRNA pseudouridine(38-40) synthase TruA [Zwartia sp.]